MALHKSNELPILPASRLRAMLLLHNPDATVQDFVQVFVADPALTVAALAAANSAASAPVKPIAAVREAVVRIGVQQARHIAVSSLMRSQFDVRLSESWIEVGAFWEHSVVVGLLTEAMIGDVAAPGVSFTAGFLHDLGRLALVSENPFRYRQVLDLAKADAPIEGAERRICGQNHLVIGQRLADRWGLPAAIGEAAGGHHDREGTSTIAMAVYHARRISWKLGYGDGVLTPDVVQFDDETASVLRHFGGEEGLRERVHWYANASAGESA